jgi:hypothetical protein
MNFDLRPLFSPSYWLTLDPPAVWEGAGRSLIVVFVGMLIASVVVRRMKLPQAKDRHEAGIYRRVIEFLTVMGAIGIVLFFFSFEQIRLLGARPLYLAWIAGLVAWIVTIVRYARRDVPGARQREQDRAARDKYLPKRSKR